LTKAAFHNDACGNDTIVVYVITYKMTGERVNSFETWWKSTVDVQNMRFVLFWLDLL